MPEKYRKKPVVIEANKFDGGWDSVYELCRWAGDNHPFSADPVMPENGEFVTEWTLTIDTLEGRMNVAVGDYVIKGVQGEFYPCKPDIFEQTYEKVENE